MRSTLVLHGTITGVNQTKQAVDVTDSNGDIHTQDILPALPNEVWLSTCGYLCGLSINVLLTERSTMITVIEPDLLVDVSEAASAVGTRVTGHIARRLRIGEFIPAAMVGSIINGVFDLMVQDPTLSDQEYAAQAIASRPLAMALVARRGESVTVEEQVAACIPLLRSMQASWSGDLLDLEPLYMSPQWGLQGRADIIRTVGDRIHVVEMKAGKAPSGTGTIRNDHAAQVAGYAAILGVSTHTPIDASVWYVRATENPVRDVDADAMIGPLIGARNTLVLADLALQQRSIEPLRWLGIATRDGSSYEFRDIEELRVAMRGCDPLEVLVVRAWLAMAAELHASVRIGGNGQRSMSDVWKVPYADKRSLPSVLTDLMLDTEASEFSLLHIAFRRSGARADTSLRVGDQVIIYPQPSDDASPCDAAMYKGVIRELNATHVRVAFRNKFIHRTVFDRDLWCIEQDVMDVSARSVYAGIRAFIDASARQRAVLLGRESPAFALMRSIQAPDCTDEQRLIIERAIAARELFLIQGPPGTGKTSTVIRRIMQELVSDTTERVLAVAYTNRAANELCAVLDRHGVPYLRHGSVEGTEGARAIPHLSRVLSPERLAHELTSAQCVVSTVQSMYSGHEIWEFGDFTTVIVDEASQILEPTLLGITSRVPRAILVGDHCQLPPVVPLDDERITTTNASLHDLGLSSLARSAFERLIERAERRGDTASFAMLRQQGRMHADIMSVVSDVAYDGALDTLSPWQRDQAPTIWSDILPHRAVFVSVDEDDQASAETARIVDLATMLYERAVLHDSKLDLGIITPFRIQNTRIREMLSDELRDYVTVDTVERFQGSERDVIIYGTAVASESELASITSTTLVHGRSVDRKLNVAITRARQQLIVVGNTRVLCTSPAYRAIINRLAPMPSGTK